LQWTTIEHVTTWNYKKHGEFLLKYWELWEHIMVLRKKKFAANTWSVKWGEIMVVFSSSWPILHSV
jgi:hypothetical protein